MEGAPGAEAQTRRPPGTAFKQQRLPAKTPLLTPVVVISFFFVVGMVFLPIGIALLRTSQGVTEVRQMYSTPENPNVAHCSPATRSQACTVNVTVHVPTTIKGPVYFYYTLDRFHQNYRAYVKYRSDLQLRGEPVTKKQLDTACKNYFQNPPGISNCDPNDPTKPCWSPCGLAAMSLFNDTFPAFVALNASGLEPGTDLTRRWSGSEISWKSDRAKKFSNGPACSKVKGYAFPGQSPEIAFAAMRNASGGGPLPAAAYCWTDIEAEDFIVWMRMAGLPSFRKLHRVIDGDLPAGTYTLTVNNVYPTAAFGASKGVLLTSMSWMGGRNDFIGLAYLASGTLCILVGAVFLAKHLHSPRKLGDPRFLVWSRQLKRTAGPS